MQTRLDTWLALRDVGTADLIKLAMIAVQNRTDLEPLKSKLVMRVDDELILEAPDNELSKCASIILCR